MVLTAQIDGTHYWAFYSGLRKEAKKRGLPLGSEETVETLLRERDLICSLRLRLRPFIQQVIGHRAASFDFPLATDRRQAIHPGGGSFAPNVYLASGSIAHLSEKPLTPLDSDGEPGLSIVLDCGLLVTLGAFDRGGSSGGPGIQRRDISKDAWIAALGPLHAGPSDTADDYAVRCRVLRPTIFDLNPASGTFGSFVPWSFARKAPADADVFSVPVTLLTLEVLGAA